MPTIHPSIKNVGNYGYIGSKIKHIKVHNTPVRTSHLSGDGGDKTLICTALMPI